MTQGLGVRARWVDTHIWGLELRTCLTGKEGGSEHLGDGFLAGSPPFPVWRWTCAQVQLHKSVSSGGRNGTLAQDQEPNRARPCGLIKNADAGVRDGFQPKCVILDKSLTSEMMGDEG